MLLDATDESGGTDVKIDNKEYKVLSKDDILALISGTPSIRSVSDLNDNAIRNLENQWHKIYIGFQSLLGQLKVQQRQTEKKGLFSFFKK